MGYTCRAEILAIHDVEIWSRYVSRVVALRFLISGIYCTTLLVILRKDCMVIYEFRKCALKCQLPSIINIYKQFLTTPRSFHIASHAIGIDAQRALVPNQGRNCILLTMAKRKSTSTALQGRAITTVPIHPPPFDDDLPPPPKRRASQRKVSQPKPDTGSTNPDKNANVLDAPEALRASPDGDETMNLEKAGMDVEKQVKEEDSDSPLSEAQEIEEPVEKIMGIKTGKTATAAKIEDKEKSKKPTVAAKRKSEPTKEPQFLDPEAEGDEEADEEEIQAALSRPPPVNSNYLPLPWKGRLGYVSSPHAFDCVGHY